MLGLGNGILTETSSSPVDPFRNQYAIDLDGSNQFINCENDSSIKPTAAITIAAWIYPDNWDVSAATHIVSAVHVGGWNIQQAASDRLYAQIKSGDSYRNLQTAALTSYSGWHHVMITFDGQYARMYLDGEAPTGSGVIASVDIGSSGNAIQYGTGDNNVDVLIGADPGALTSGTAGTSAGTSPFPGLIDEVAIWDAALSEAAALEIGTKAIDLTIDWGNYTNSGDLQGYWRMEEGTGSTVADSSTNSNTGALKNSPTFNVLGADIPT